VTALNQLREHIILPVVVADDRDCAAPLREALVAGGLPLVEVTFRTAAAPDVIRVLASRGDIFVGAGTILTAAQVDTAVDAGATFIVSPGLSRAVVDRCLERAAHGALAMTTPGDTSMMSKADVVKPASGGGARVER
jgi:2-dehydro-3-deoxyphosphogluconate aldolase/(4S)-4-hydroxy-2-oxoglutarate aldolase